MPPFASAHNANRISMSFHRLLLGARRDQRIGHGDAQIIVRRLIERPPLLSMLDGRQLYDGRLNAPARCDLSWVAVCATMTEFGVAAMGINCREQNISSMFCHASYRKTAAHFFGSTLVGRDHAMLRRASVIRPRMRSIAGPRPPNTASPMRKCPMVSSTICGIRAMAPTVLKVRPWPA